MMSSGFIKTKGCGPHQEMLICGILSTPGRCACATSEKSNADYFCLILESWGVGGGCARVCGEEYSLKELLERTEVCLA